MENKLDEAKKKLLASEAREAELRDEMARIKEIGKRHADMCVEGCSHAPLMYRVACVALNATSKAHLQKRLAEVNEILKWIKALGQTGYHNKDIALELFKNKYEAERDTLTKLLSGTA